MKTFLKSFLIAGVLMMPSTVFAAEGDSAATIISDSLITSQVKLEFAKASHLNAKKIVVNTDSLGVVRLSGTVKSSAESEKAAKLAKMLDGVTSVKNDLVVK
jgi:hyperosmotically inducible protein